MSNTVKVCCRLPNGYAFPNPEVPADKQRHHKYLKLNGANRSHHFEGHDAQQLSEIILSPVHYGVTEVDKDVWDKIVKNYGEDFAPFRSQAIFWDKQEADVKKKVNKLVADNVKTGFEALGKGTLGVENYDGKTD